MVPALDYFASGRNYPMKSDYEIGLVPPLAYFASGGNYPIIRMMKSEWLPLPDPCSHICLCPNRIDSFETINFIFGVDAGVILVKILQRSVYLKQFPIPGFSKFSMVPHTEHRHSNMESQSPGALFCTLFTSFLRFGPHFPIPGGPGAPL